MSRYIWKKRWLVRETLVRGVWPYANTATHQGDPLLLLGKSEQHCCVEWLKSCGFGGLHCLQAKLLVGVVWEAMGLRHAKSGQPPSIAAAFRVQNSPLPPQQRTRKRGMEPYWRADHARGKQVDGGVRCFAIRSTTSLALNLS